eukprot:336043_1
MLSSLARFSSFDDDELIKTSFKPCKIKETLHILCQNDKIIKMNNNPNVDLLDYESVSRLFYCWVVATGDTIVDADKHKFRFCMFIKHIDKNGISNTYQKIFDCNYNQIKSAYTKYKHLLPDEPIEETSPKTTTWRHQLLQAKINECLNNIQIHSNSWYYKQIVQSCFHYRFLVVEHMKKLFQGMCREIYVIDLLVLYLYGTKADRAVDYILDNIKREQRKIILLNKYTVVRHKLEAYITMNENEECKSEYHECIGTNTSVFSKNTAATIKDATVLSIILNGMFNSPLIVFNNQFYDEFPDQFDDEMKLLLKSLADTSRTFLRNKSLKLRMKQKNAFQYLYNDNKLNLIEFHRVYAVRKGNNFHWGLKFEGFDKLLSLDYFESSRIHVQILTNNAIGQRLFWYGEPVNHETAEFNKIWTADFYKRNLNETITTKQIGYLIEIWIKQQPIYNPMKNNCRHFVRDMISYIDVNTAKQLTAKLHRTTISRILFVGNVIKKEEEDRIIEINWILKLYTFLAMNNMAQYYDDLKDYNLKQVKSLSEEKINEIFSNVHKNVYKTRITLLN